MIVIILTTPILSSNVGLISMLISLFLLLVAILTYKKGYDYSKKNVITREDLEKSEKEAKQYTDDRIKGAHERIRRVEERNNSFDSKLDNIYKILIEIKNKA